jgi:hypothetical protein
MRRSRARRESPLAYAAIGAAIFGIPASAFAATPAHHSNSVIQTRTQRRHVAYGHELVFTGRAASSEAGETATLQFLPGGAGAWQQVASGTVSRRGSIRLVAWLPRSGWLKPTVGSSPAASAMMPVASSASTVTGGSSRPSWVQVAAAIRVRPQSINQLGARTVGFRGQLVPGRSGRTVLLQGDRFGRWNTLAAARTDRQGTFDLRYRSTQATQERLRIRFDGDGTNGATASGAGSLTVYQPVVASWYEDAGSTACGFHSYYGVASPSLPCGTQVTFVYGGRKVAAVVDDRGPFVPGRDFDLNQNTAASLGFGGVDTVWASQ